MYQVLLYVFHEQKSQNSLPSHSSKGGKQTQWDKYLTKERRDNGNWECQKELQFRWRRLDLWGPELWGSVKKRRLSNYWGNMERPRWIFGGEVFQASGTVNERP